MDFVHSFSIKRFYFFPESFSEHTFWQYSSFHLFISYKKCVLSHFNYFFFFFFKSWLHSCTSIFIVEKCCLNDYLQTQSKFLQQGQNRLLHQRPYNTVSLCLRLALEDVVDPRLCDTRRCFLSYPQACEHRRWLALAWHPLVQLASWSLRITHSSVWFWWVLKATRHTWL